MVTALHRTKNHKITSEAALAKGFGSIYYGHGNNNLCSVFAMLMMLMFLIDQVQAIGCALFKKARLLLQSNKLLWFRMKSMFEWFVVDSWEQFFQKLIKHAEGNTS